MYHFQNVLKVLNVLLFKKKKIPTVTSKNSSILHSLADLKFIQSISSLYSEYLS